MPDKPLRHHWRRLSLSLLLASTVGCETTPPTPPPSQAEPEAPASSAPPEARPTMPSSPTKPLPRASNSQRPTKALPVRPINISSDCNFYNETGYHGVATLEVRNGEVLRMRSIINVPKRGQCVFELASMRQTASLPSIELRAKQGKCVARIWEQGDRITLAFNDCHAQCSSADAFRYVWPVLFDRPSGRCQ